MDAVKARELVEVYEAIRGSNPRGDHLAAEKLAAAFVFEGKRAPDPHRVGLNSMAVKYANEHDVDLLAAYRAIGKRYREIFIDPDLEMRGMAGETAEFGPRLMGDSAKPSSSASRSAASTAAAQADLEGLDFQSQVVVRKTQELARANGRTYDAQLAARTTPVQAVEIVDQASAVGEWADDEAARTGKSAQKAIADHAAARVKEANERNRRGGR
jgi:hypothetical protein